MKPSRHLWLVIVTLACALACAIPLTALAAEAPVGSNNADKHEYPWNWAMTPTSFLHETPDGALERVELVAGELTVERISNNYMTATSKKVIPDQQFVPSDCIWSEREYQEEDGLMWDSTIGASSEGPLRWGGFFSGSDANYIAVGQKNLEESDSRVVVRITKFSKDWKYLGYYEAKGANTYIPFDASYCDFAEVDSVLYLRAAHEMYTSSDGLNHQACMTFAVKTSDMSLVEADYEVWNQGSVFGYVSHSFCQHLAVLDGEVYAVDHGDAYPRAITAKHLGQTYGGYVNLVAFEGEHGQNYTGATLGGFESSATAGTLLAVGSMADQSLCYTGSNVAMNIWVAVVPATAVRNGDAEQVVVKQLTSYGNDSHPSVGNPFLVKVGENRFCVMWKESTDSQSTLHYCFIDGQGNTIGATKTANATLSDCQPIVRNGKIVWYAGGASYEWPQPSFFEIDASTGAFSAARPVSSADIAIEGATEAYDDNWNPIGWEAAFTGQAIKPSVRLSFEGTTLKEGTDYTVAYEKTGRNVGETTRIVITGKGDLKGSMTIDVSIAPGSLSDVVVESVPSPTYNGKAQTPEPVVKLNGVTLKKGTDYTVSYENNVNAGQAWLLLEATANMTGFRYEYFDINPADLSKATIASIPAQAYTGWPVYPSVAVTLNGRTLQDNDYDVDYINNVGPGTATVRVYSTWGNYRGEVKKNFTIGESSESDDPEFEPDPITDKVTRLSGDNALDTMVAILTEGDFPKDGTVVLANAWGYHDALTAAGIAGLEGAPVIMTDGVSLSDQARAMLKELTPKKIIACGGTGSISQPVLDAAKAIAGATSIMRCAGDNAAGTAVDIFEKGSGWSDTAIIATSGTYHDALAAAPLSFASHLPIFMTEWTGALSDATIKAMKAGGIKKAYIAGGEYWIPNSTVTQLKNAGITVVKRLSGNTAVETSAAIAQEAVSVFGMTADGLGVATTVTHYDALAGAAFCGKNNTVLLLADDGNRSSITGFAQNSADLEHAYVLGGPSSVSSATMSALVSAVG